MVDERPAVYYVDDGRPVTYTCVVEDERTTLEMSGRRRRMWPTTIERFLRRGVASVWRSFHGSALALSGAAAPAYVWMGDMMVVDEGAAAATFSLSMDFCRRWRAAEFYRFLVPLEPDRWCPIYRGN